MSSPAPTPSLSPATRRSSPYASVVVRLGFLGPRRFAAKTPIYWLLDFLDFLGFSRPNRDLSMGYAA